MQARMLHLEAQVAKAQTLLADILDSEFVSVSALEDIFAQGNKAESHFRSMHSESSALHCDIVPVRRRDTSRSCCFTGFSYLNLDEIGDRVQNLEANLVGLTAMLQAIGSRGRASTSGSGEAESPLSSAAKARQGD
jgi:hypothetical protein